ncbi:MAG: peroxide stress protein YaaA [Pseudomonadota bacterium]
MLAIVSPAKTLDYESRLVTKKYSEPRFLGETFELIEQLRTLAPADLSALMNISDNLAELNHRRYAEWDRCLDNTARQAILAFKGDVYLGLDAPTMSERDFTWAQKHLRILSGLHGLLRPLDRINPYRLEMGTQLTNSQGKNLYEFWGSKVTDALNQDLAALKKPILINLASNEYYGVLQADDIQARIIDVQFKELRDGQYRFLSFFAKKARGLMARYMIDQRIKTLKALKQFDYEGYAYNDELSHGDHWVFTRTPQE